MTDSPNLIQFKLKLKETEDNTQISKIFYHLTIRNETRVEVYELDEPIVFHVVGAKANGFINDSTELKKRELNQDSRPEVTPQGFKF